MINIVTLAKPRYCLLKGKYPGLITDWYKDRKTGDIVETVVQYYTENGTDYTNVMAPYPYDYLHMISKADYNRRYEELSVQWALRFIEEAAR